MSGGGYSRDRKRDQDDWNRPQPELLPESEDETTESYSATEVENLLDEELKNINNHDYDAINKHRDEIQKKLYQVYEESEIIRYGGSHSRHTDVDKLSDVDILATLGDVSKLPRSSNAAINQLAEVLRERFPRTQIETGKMAVTVKFSDGIEVQILPTYRVDKDTYKIPNPINAGWINTKPKAFANVLTDVNKQNSGRVVPLIKLVKRICDAKQIDLKSYHIENMAIEAFQHYSGTRSLAQMLKHFFNDAKSRVYKAIQDPAGQSNDVSSYMTQSDRTRVSGKLNHIDAEITGAMDGKLLNRWRSLFKE